MGLYMVPFFAQNISIRIQTFADYSPCGAEGKGLGEIR